MKIGLLALLACMSLQGHTVKKQLAKMGSPFEITAVHEDKQAAEAAIDAAFKEIDRLELMISSWRDDSETARINRAAGQAPVAVSPELFNLIRRSLKVSQLTEGAFDISFAGMGKLWDFKAVNPVIPDPQAIQNALRHVDYRNIVLDPESQTVFLKEPGMRIGFGGIGKGYGANRAVFILKSYGVTGGVVNAGGDLVAFGLDEGGEPWRVSIAHPREKKRVMARLRLTEQAVVTSGDYERFIMVDGKRYSHIINPKTGYPAHELVSVTIICPDAELADALATATFVLGPEKGMALINGLKRIECILVDVNGKVYYSKQIQNEMEPTEDSL